MEAYTRDRGLTMSVEEELTTRLQPVTWHDGLCELATSHKEANKCPFPLISYDYKLSENISI